MPYDIKLAAKIREYLNEIPKIKIEEKKMFRGITFMVNNKMCICVSGENLMCRFNPILQYELSTKLGFQPMIMKGKKLKGYCYVTPDGIKTKKNFEFWISTCLDFNKQAKAPKKDK